MWTLEQVLFRVVVPAAYADLVALAAVLLLEHHLGYGVNCLSLAALLAMTWLDHRQPLPPLDAV